jgi:hypothetical protein
LKTFLQLKSRKFSTLLCIGTKIAITALRFCEDSF